jgi:hypothetical protein
MLSIGGNGDSYPNPGYKTTPGGYNGTPGGYNPAPNSSLPNNNYINPPVPPQALNNIVVTTDLGTPDGAYIAEFNTSSAGNPKLFIPIDSRQLHGPNGDRYLGI